MRKYWAIVKIGFKNALTYRADFFLWGFNEFLGTLVFLFIWSVIFGEKGRIGGFSLPETITYLIGVGLINNIISTAASRFIQRDVQSGRLSNLILIPLNYPLVRLFLSLSAKPVNLLIRFFAYFAVALFFKGKLVVSSNFPMILLTPISVVFAFAINFLVDYLTGCISFWTITTEGPEGIVRTIKNIFSGNYAPISFFPPGFQVIANFLPFIYIQYFPMLIYLGKVSTIEAIKGIGLQIFWVVVLYFLARAVWRKGLKKYEGVGI